MDDVLAKANLSSNGTWNIPGVKKRRRSCPSETWKTSVQLTRSVVPTLATDLARVSQALEIACTKVGDAFSDPGRSRRTPSFDAYSRNAMSTSYKISTWSQ